MSVYKSIFKIDLNEECLMQKTLQQLIDETPEGGVLHLGETEYKESVTIAKNITIVGEKEDVPPKDSVYGWCERNYRTHIEGNLIITAQNVVVQNCEFWFEDVTLALNNCIKPKFIDCRFNIYSSFMKISGIHTNPSFIWCEFSGPEDDECVCISDGAGGYFENCISREFCVFLIQGDNTKPVFKKSRFWGFKSNALHLENGAEPIMYDSYFFMEYE